VTRSVPQIVSVGAALLGVALFFVTLYYIDLDETVASAARLGAALPIVLLPGTAWHLLRTWGWSLAFPDDARPVFTRLFRVRLAADAIGFFTVRGIAGEPLKVLLLYDRVKPEVATAAITLERLVFAVVGTAIAGVVSLLAITRVTMSGRWDALFALLALGAVLLLTIVGFMARRRSKYYLEQVGAISLSASFSPSSTCCSICCAAIAGGWQRSSAWPSCATRSWRSRCGWCSGRSARRSRSRNHWWWKRSRAWPASHRHSCRATSARWKHRTWPW